MDLLCFKYIFLFFGSIIIIIIYSCLCFIILFYLFFCNFILSLMFGKHLLFQSAL